MRNKREIQVSSFICSVEILKGGGSHKALIGYIDLRFLAIFFFIDKRCLPPSQQTLTSFPNFGERNCFRRYRSHVPITSSGFVEFSFPDFWIVK